MRTFILRDYQSGETDAILTTDFGTTAEEISNIIADTKNKYKMDWSWEDIVEALADNGVYAEVINRNNEVWY
jgi:hypothetical protein